MKLEEFEKIPIVEKQKLASRFKIKSYKKKLKFMVANQIPQKDINWVLKHLFLSSNIISEKTKSSISKIIYSIEDRIIILITKSGKEIIWNRDKLVNEYGWFFFVSEADKTKKREKKKAKSENKEEEVTISKDSFEYGGLTIEIKEKRNMRSLYHTKEYFQYFKLINSHNISQTDFKKVIKDIFHNNTVIPEKEKKSIRKMIYYEKERVIVIKSLNADVMYEHLESLVKKYGWYFYITGVPVGESDISLAINKIEKRWDETYFQNISLLSGEAHKNDIRVTIYPIILKPNHNAHILGLGKLNILIDCGFTPPNEETNEEGDFHYITEYLENLPQILEEEINNLQREDLEKSSKKFEDNISNPFKTSKPNIDAIFLSHSHYDHISGLKEMIKHFPDVPILCSRITLDLYLLRDSNFLKQESQSEIEEEEYQNIVRNVICVENGSKIDFKEKECYLSFYHAGHMPGALMILAKVKDFRFLYTGDYTYYDITPFAGTKRFLGQISKPIDYLLIDGTCAMDDYGDINEAFHSLILFLEQKAEYEDNVLIGADPSSLAITFMLVFWRYFRKLQLRKNFKKRPNIYVDMMVKKNIQVINTRYKYIYGPISKLIRDKANPFNSIKFRWFDVDELDFLRKKNNIIISHPPDLSYGIIRNIINVIGRSPHNLVYLAGSVHEEPGLSLVNGAEEIEFSETWKAPFRALLINSFVPQLKIILHSDKKQLTKMIENLEPKEVCFFHQSAKSLYEVVEYVKELGVEKVSLPQKRKLLILN
ncbi:MAG: MBL fold metallo-hydrolase [Promethearchaeota archaeon]|nr:MAG: MBL fold metallo-hydrolase [Candidatus Lokiarchaeota archaeon]